MGGCGLAYEYTFSKMASDLLGNSVQQWAVIIAIMLFCMGVGAEVQRFIPSRQVTRLLIISQLGLALLGGFGPILSLCTFAYFPYQFGLVHYTIISVIGVLIGLEIPLISRLNMRFSADIQSNLANVLKMDYIGALVGALVWVFLLPRFFTLAQVAYVLGMLSLSTAFICWWFYRQQLRSSWGYGASFIIVLVGLAIGYAHSHKWAVSAEQALYNDRVVYSTTTPYQHIVLTQSHGGVFRCYINGHIQFSSDDECIYHEHLVHPAMTLAGRRERVLILGGGDGMAAREVLTYPDVREITLVDLDPAMTQLFSDHPVMRKLNSGALSAPAVRRITSESVQQGDRYDLSHLPQRRLRREVDPVTVPDLHLMNIDAANYVQSITGRYDVIILDFPDPSSLELAKLYSKPFYTALRHKLTADGIIVQQSTSPHRAREAFLCIGRTMEAAGLAAVPYHDHVPSFGEWGWWIATHAEVQSRRELQQRMAGIRELPAGLRYLTPQLVHASLHFGKGSLQTDETDVTTLTHPAVLRYYLHGWSQ